MLQIGRLQFAFCSEWLSVRASKFFRLSWEYDRDLKDFFFLDLGQWLHPVCQDESRAAPAQAGAGSPVGLAALGSPSTLHISHKGSHWSRTI